VGGKMAEDIVDRVDALKKYKKSFILSPDQWEALTLGSLAWECVKFEEGNKVSVPKARGFIALLLNMNTPHCQPMLI
jgi:hypothetical protein